MTMRHLKGPHLMLRDHILGFEAKQVIDAEFREIGAPETAGRRRSALAALKKWFGHLLSGRVAAFGSPAARLHSARHLRG